MSLWDEVDEQAQNDFTVRSMFGHNTRKPFVVVRLGDVYRNMYPSKAREIATMLFEASEAAEQDAFLFEFMSQFAKGNDPDEADRIGTVALSEYRKWREEKSR